MKPEIEIIIKEVCKYFDKPIELVQLKSRKREVVQLRQICMYFAKQFTNYSLETISYDVGNKDHVTCLHSVKTISNLIEVDIQIRTDIENLEKEIKLKLYNIKYELSEKQKLKLYKLIIESQKRLLHKKHTVSNNRTRLIKIKKRNCA